MRPAVDGASMEDVAKVYISFDFELAWGVIANGNWRRREAAGVYERLTDTFPQLVDVLESREIGVDWATVGALLIDPQRVPTEHLPTDYAAAVQTFVTESKPSTRDGRRLVDRLLATRFQRLISHGMTHVVLDRTDLGPAGIVADLSAADRALASVGHTGAALVFPENRECGDEPLLAAGVRVVRTAPRYHSGRLQRGVQKVLSPPVATVSGADVRRLSGSLLFQPRGTRSRDLGLFALQRAAVVRAVGGGRSVCLWLHPFNIGVYPRLLKDLTSLLDELCRLRDTGRARFASALDVR